MSLAFDEYGRPFIIIRVRAGRRRVIGPASSLVPRLYLLTRAVPTRGWLTLMHADESNSPRASGRIDGVSAACRPRRRCPILTRTHFNAVSRRFNVFRPIVCVGAGEQAADQGSGCREGQYPGGQGGVAGPPDVARPKGDG